MEEKETKPLKDPVEDCQQSSQTENATTSDTVVSSEEFDLNNSKECEVNTEEDETKANSTDCEEEFRRPDVLSMIDRLLDEDNTEEVTPVNIPPTVDLSNSFKLNSLNCSERLFPIPSNGYYEQVQRSCSEDCRYGINFTGYKPPSQVKVQLNFNGQQTVTSTSLQDFRRLIGLKDSPRKSYQQNYRRPVSRGYDYCRNGFHESYISQYRNQMDCATRFALRFGKIVCDELRDCLVTLRRITELRTQTEKLMASRSWMPINGEPWNLPPPSDSCCMIDWLVFEFLKEYCNTNNFLKSIDQGCGNSTSGDAFPLMKEWLEQIRYVDTHRRAGFCDCSCHRATVSPEKALQLLRGLNEITDRVNIFVSSLMQLVKPSFPVTGMFKGTIN